MYQVQRHILTGARLKRSARGLEAAQAFVNNLADSGQR